MHINNIKIGTKVKVKDEIVLTKNTSHLTFNHQMYKHIGGTYTVLRKYSVGVGSVTLKEIAHEWLPEWLEPLTEASDTSDDNINIHDIYKE